jgi:hypothetical protein
MKKLSLLLLLLLPACEHSLVPKATLALGASCKAYANALRVLTPMKAEGQLTKEQIQLVDKSNSAVDELCLGEPPEDIYDAISRVSAATNAVLLLTLEEKK